MTTHAVLSNDLARILLPLSRHDEDRRTSANLSRATYVNTLLRDFRLDYILIRFQVFIHQIYNLFASVEPVLPFLFLFLFARR